MKDRVVSTVGYAAATCFFILCPNSELFLANVWLPEHDPGFATVFFHRYTSYFHCLFYTFVDDVDPLSVRKLSNSSWSSDGVHIRLALDAGS